MGEGQVTGSVFLPFSVSPSGFLPSIQRNNSFLPRPPSLSCLANLFPVFLPFLHHLRWCLPRDKRRFASCGGLENTGPTAAEEFCAATGNRQVYIYTLSWTGGYIYQYARERRGGGTLCGHTLSDSTFRLLLSCACCSPPPYHVDQTRSRSTYPSWVKSAVSAVATLVLLSRTFARHQLGRSSLCLAVPPCVQKTTERPTSIGCWCARFSLSRDDGV